MRILADMHISPVTVKFLQGLGHDVVRINLKNAVGSHK